MVLTKGEGLRILNDSARHTFSYDRNGGGGDERPGRGTGVSLGGLSKEVCVYVHTCRTVPRPVSLSHRGLRYYRIS